MTLAHALIWTGSAVVTAAWVLQLTRAKEDHIAQALFAVGYWIGFIANVLDASPLWSTIDGLLAAFYTYLWWKNRPRGKKRKALQELGAKSRARVQALVEQMTPSPIPSPVGAS